MKKSLQSNTIYKQASFNEASLLASAADSGLPSFTASNLRALSGWAPQRVANAISSMVRKGILVRLVRGRYCIASETEGAGLSIAASAAAPAYVSFWTALAFHGLTEQQPSAIQLVSTRQAKPFRVGGRAVEVTRFKPSRFFGYDASGMATAEKALLDSLCIPAKAGGLGEVARCFGSAKGVVSVSWLARAAARIGDRTLASRAGYLAMETGLGELPGMSRHISLGFVKLDPTGGKPFAYDGKWRVAVNRRLP